MKTAGLVAIFLLLQSLETEVTTGREWMVMAVLRKRSIRLLFLVKQKSPQ